jgi:hypothetical protein
MAMILDNNLIMILFIHYPICYLFKLMPIELAVEMTCPNSLHAKIYSHPFILHARCLNALLEGVVNKTVIGDVQLCVRKARPCLVPKKNCKIFQISRYIESCGTCM